MHDVIDIPTDFARAYVFDMDGTIYLGEHLLPGARRMIEELRRREIPVRFLSNNPTKDPDQYVDKLTRLGLPTAIEDISNTSLVSETRNPQTMDLDALSTLELVNRFNQQDTLVALAVKETLPEVAKAVDAAADALKAGGRIIYMGAGTSGRLGVLDASECPPTFGVPHGLVVGLIAGGPGALLKAVEGAEDNKQLGEDDLRALNLTAQDLVVGLAASGRTPYVIGGLEYARQTGCTTVAISCNPGSPIAQVAAIAISPVVGPEALTGSTRLKSGTAQKLVLNMISTGAMVKFGKVYQNLMVDMQATNVKLVDRACRMVMEATGAGREEAEAVLKQTDYDVKPAILMILTGLDAAAARARLEAHHGFLRAALEHQ